MMPSPVNPALTQPYPGLRPFFRSEAELFFGRADQINRMLGRLEEKRFLAVVGGSGSGKSSLVRAGLLPVLEQGYLLGAGTDWRFVVMRPGGDPFGNLATEFHLAIGAGEVPDASDVAFTRAALQTSPRGFLEVVEEAGLSTGVPLLVLVDQFEEIFRFRRRRAASGPAGEGQRAVHEVRNDATAFVNLLLTTAEVATQAALPIYVVITMRSDFIGDCDVFPRLPQAISDSQFLVPRLTRQQMQEVIEKPDLLFGWKAAPDLVNQMLNDAGTDPDQLPLLQHALMRTWFAAKAKSGSGSAERVLSLAEYNQVGRFSDALSQHLEEAWNSLKDEREQRIAQQLFLSLSERSAEGALIRRMVTLGEVAAVANAEAGEVMKVVGVFQQEGRNFVMASPPGALSAESVLDISHEALLRQWARLRAWLDEEAKSAERYIRLADAASRWNAGEAELLQGRELERALEWKETRNPTAIWAERYHGGSFDLALAYLEKSRAARDRQLADLALERQWRPWGLLVIALAATIFLWGLTKNWFSEEFQAIAQTAEKSRLPGGRAAPPLPSIASTNSLRDLFDASNSTTNRWQVQNGTDLLFIAEVFQVRHPKKSDWFWAFAKLAAAFACYMATAYSGKWIFRRVARSSVLREVEFAGTTAARDEKLRLERIGDAALAWNTTYASFWRRAVAHLIDLTLFWIGLIIAIVVVELASWSWLLSETQNVLVLLSPLLCDWLYQAGMIRSHRQATLGMRAMGLFITDWRGERLTFGRATTRHFAKLLCYLTFGIGFFMQPFSARRQALHDRVAKSVVLVRPGRQKLPKYRLALALLIGLAPYVAFMFVIR